MVKKNELDPAIEKLIDDVDIDEITRAVRVLARGHHFLVMVDVNPPGGDGELLPRMIIGSNLPHDAMAMVLQLTAVACGLDKARTDL